MSISIKDFMEHKVPRHILIDVFDKVPVMFCSAGKHTPFDILHFLFFGVHTNNVVEYVYKCHFMTWELTTELEDIKPLDKPQDYYNENKAFYDELVAIWSHPIWKHPQLLITEGLFSTINTKAYESGKEVLDKIQSYLENVYICYYSCGVSHETERYIPDQMNVESFIASCKDARYDWRPDFSVSQLLLELPLGQPWPCYRSSNTGCCLHTVVMLLPDLVDEWLAADHEDDIKKGFAWFSDYYMKGRIPVKIKERVHMIRILAMKPDLSRTLLFNVDNKEAIDYVLQQEDSSTGISIMNMSRVALEIAEAFPKVVHIDSVPLRLPGQSLGDWCRVLADVNTIVKI